MVVVVLVLPAGAFSFVVGQGLFFLLVVSVSVGGVGGVAVGGQGLFYFVVAVVVTSVFVFVSGW